ncbi:hypothetical protein ACWD25_42240 [Streptomyces sp. NPDC002920]
MIQPTLKPIPEDRSARCGWCTTPTQDDPCNASATWHIAWRLDPNADCSFACEPHMEAVRSLFVYADRHPVGPGCSMPDVDWVRSDPSFCGLPPDSNSAASQRSKGAALT